MKRVLVWDIPTRIFHWSLALSFAGAFLTSESERYRDIHEALGYLMLGLIAFRIIWGFIGTRHARFASFLFKPTAIAAYLRSLLHRHPQHFAGHNPAGGIAIFMLLGLGLATTTSGILLYQEIGGEFFEEWHEGAANLMLALVFIHLAGVLASSVLHHDNLARAMVTGHKRAALSEGITRSYAWLGVIMLLVILGYLAGQI